MAVYELSNDYLESEIFDIQYAQINDIIYLAHPDHPPKKLTRYAANSWSLSTLSFIGGPFMPDNLTSISISTTGLTGTVTITASSAIFTVSGATLGHKDTYWKIFSTVTDSTTGLAVQGYVKLTTITNTSTATATVMKTLSATGSTTNWAEGSWSDVNGWPARVTFHQQRLFFARTDQEPQNVWGSKSFSFEDFAVDGGADDDAINIQLASNESNDIKWLFPISQSLIAGSYGGEFAIQTGDGSPLTPATTNVTKETSWGSEAVVPKRVGNFAYYIQRFGRKVRELFFDFNLNGYKSIDRTILSPHICGDGIVDLAYQQNPDTMIWAVTSEGTISTMTREVDQDVTGWARQTTTGNYESIATIPSATEPNDEVWVVVKRTLASGAERRYIERFKSQIVPDRKDMCFYVHSGLTYDAYATDLLPTGATISLSATAGTTVTVTSSVAYFASNDIGQRIRAINTDGETVGELLINAFTSSTVVNGEVKYTFSATSYSTGTWGLSVSSISGLDHLEGLTVTVLADGGLDKPDKVVSGGAISLAYNYFVITAGLPYTQKIQTLPQEIGSERGTAQGKIQRISQVGFKVNNSHTGFYYGKDEDNLDKVQFRQGSTLMGVPEALYTGIIPNLSFNGDYAYGAQMWVENLDPLPIELLSIITSVDTFDK